jgi:acyl-CoA synthetase (AMP-forming)/AMP-acid ligase II
LKETVRLPARRSSAHNDRSGGGKADTAHEGKADANEVSPEALIDWCAETLAKFKVPRYVRFVPEFPMTASGKVQKYKLREEHQEQLSPKSEV